MVVIDKNGNRLEDAVEIEQDSVLGELFRVRVIAVSYFKIGENTEEKKIVAGEMDFKTFPSDGQILYCIKYFHGDFAVVEKVFYEDHIPFAKEQ